MTFDRLPEYDLSPDLPTVQLLNAVRVRLPRAMRAFSGGSFSVTAANTRILNLLEQPIPMPFHDDTPLGDIIEHVRRATQSLDGKGIPVHVDPIGLQEAEKSMTSTVLLGDLEGVPLKTSLGLCMGQLALRYEVSGGTLVITSADQPLSEDEDAFTTSGQCVLALIAAATGGAACPSRLRITTPPDFLISGFDLMRNRRTDPGVASRLVMLHSFRFGIACLMGAVPAGAIAAAAILRPSATWAGVLFLLASGTLCLAFVGLLCRGKTERAWWLGVSLFGWGYWTLAFGGSPRFQVLLPTTHLLEWLGFQLFPADYFEWTKLETQRVPFLQSGHCLVTMIVAILGGTLARACSGIKAGFLENWSREPRPTATHARGSWKSAGDHRVGGVRSDRRRYVSGLNVRS